MTIHTSRSGTAIAAALLVTLGSMATAHAAVEPPRRLIYSAYRNEATAMDAFKGLRAAEDKGVIKIDSYAVITKDAAGKVTVDDLRQSSTPAGSVVGSMVGVLGGPPAGAVGAMPADPAGYLTGRDIGMSKDTVDDVRSSLQPGEAAIVVVVDEKWASTTEKVQLVNASRTMSQSFPVGGAMKEVAPQRAPTAPNPNAPATNRNLPHVDYLR